MSQNYRTDISEHQNREYNGGDFVLVNSATKSRKYCYIGLSVKVEGISLKKPPKIQKAGGTANRHNHCLWLFSTVQLISECILMRKIF